LRGVLGKTLGVPLFQEQAMQLAMVAAEFSEVEANRPRRAMAMFRHLGEIGQFESPMVERMCARGCRRRSVSASRLSPITRACG
jgi:error-prone DNA polymerase